MFFSNIDVLPAWVNGVKENIWEFVMVLGLEVLKLLWK